MNQADEARVTVLVDNLAVVKDAVSTYGFSLLIEVSRGSKTWRILFDTGPSGWVLLHNMRVVGVEPSSIDCVVISHMHRDHYMALTQLHSMLRAKHIYLPEPRGLSQRVDEVLVSGLKVEKTVYLHGRRVEVAPGVEVFGPVGSSGEVSITINAGQHRILLVACGHAGLDRVLYWSGAKRLDVIMGGLHLKNLSKDYVEKLQHAIDQRGVKLIVGLHCSHWGDNLMKTFFGSRYIVGGVGLSLYVTKTGFHLHPQQSL